MEQRTEGGSFVNILCMVLFGAAALANIFSCGAGRQTPRRVSKALLMPLLAAVYLLSVRQAEPWVVAGLALGWLGDLFLINPNRELLRTLGIGSFLLGHVCYIVAMVRRFPLAEALWVRIALPAAVVALTALIYVRMLSVLPRDMRLVGGVYYGALAALNGAAWLAFAGGGPGVLPLVLGTALFLISDTVLCRQFFTVGHPAPRYDVAVMTTYLAAQSLIITAFCL